MCTIEALKRMSEINGNIIRLHVECLLAAGENDASQLRAMPINDSTTKFDAESKQPTSQTIPYSTRQRLYDTFQSILFLLQTNAPNVLTAGKNFLDSLKDIVVCFPFYSKGHMSKEMCEIYERTKHKLENEDVVISSLLSCKDAIFED